MDSDMPGGSFTLSDGSVMQPAQFGDVNSGEDTMGIGPLGSYGEPSLVGAGAGGFATATGLGGM